MEKFLFLRLAFLFITLPFVASAQEYAVFKTTGAPKHIEGAKTVPISKGSLLKSGKVALTNNDGLIMVNNKGEVFEIGTAGSYTIADFEKHRKDTSKENFSNQYFSYVWKQMSKKEATQTHTGNVYREAVIDILESPMDSTSIYKNEITFTWKPQINVDQYYFFLINNADKTVSKMKVGGNSLTLYVGSNLLQKGNSYNWGVATSEYPDFTRIKMNHIKYLSPEQFDTKKTEMAPLIEDLKKLGLTDAEIEEHLCQYSNLCSQ